jgi:hypothetical protein
VAFDQQPERLRVPVEVASDELAIVRLVGPVDV